MVWENILKAFNGSTGLQYEVLQFKNLYGQLRTSWQTWKSLIKNKGLSYDPDMKTFTLDIARKGEMIKLLDFRYGPLKFEEELDMQFIGNRATEESLWVLTSDEPITSEGLTSDDVDLESCTNLIESFEMTIVSNTAAYKVDKLKQARKRKTKKVAMETPSR